ncbi:hypothetical protein RvY_06315, partial [Ramazzottius varieornatus]
LEHALRFQMLETCEKRMNGEIWRKCPCREENRKRAFFTSVFYAWFAVRAKSAVSETQLLVLYDSPKTLLTYYSTRRCAPSQFFFHER